VRTTEFDLFEERVMELFEAGCAAAEEFLEGVMNCWKR
jgi:hypothetical protein